MNALRKNTFGELTSESLGTLSTVLQGIKAYNLTASVAISQEVRAELEIYSYYLTNRSSTEAWSQVQSDLAGSPINQRFTTIGIPADGLTAWFENAYIESTIATSADLRQKQGEMIARIASDSNGFGNQRCLTALGENCRADECPCPQLTRPARFVVSRSATASA